MEIRKIPEVRGTSDKEGTFCLVNNLNIFCKNNYILVPLAIIYSMILYFILQSQLPLYKILYIID